MKFLNLVRICKNLSYSRFLCNCKCEIVKLDTKSIPHLNRNCKGRNENGNARKKRKRKNTPSANINSCEVLKTERYRQMLILAKISSQNAKDDFPLTLFDLCACYSRLSFERSSDILIEKRPEILILARFLCSLMYILC